jgi:hypothetical protein
LWTFDTAAYYAHLMGEFHRSSIARYNQLIDDMRNDIVRIDPFFQTARRVIDVDQRRQKSMEYVANLSPPERTSALGAGWREQLDDCLGAPLFDPALRQLPVRARASDRGRAAPVAAEAEYVLTELQQQIEANPVGLAPQFAAAPAQVVTK